MALNIPHTDQAKLGLVIRLLVGEALDWPFVVLKQNSLALFNWDSFLREFSTICDVPQLALTSAEANLW